MSKEKRDAHSDEKKEEIKEEIKEESAEKAQDEKSAEKSEEKAEEKTAEEKLKEDLAALDDRYKRALAEYDNFRKRSAKEREEFFGDGVSFALTAFLPLIDNLERAANASADEGIKMIQKQTLDILTKLGIEQIGKEGDAFDPNLHNAVAHIEDENLGENVIAEVLQKGYTRNGKLLRPALVKTAN